MAWIFCRGLCVMCLPPAPGCLELSHCVLCIALRVRHVPYLPGNQTRLIPRVALAPRHRVRPLYPCGPKPRFEREDKVTVWRKGE